MSRAKRQKDSLLNYLVASSVASLSGAGMTKQTDGISKSSSPEGRETFELNENGTRWSLRVKQVFKIQKNKTKK